MIKINLLPPGIYEKKIVRNIAIMFAVLAFAIAGGVFGYNMKLKKDIEIRTQEVAMEEAAQKRVEALQAQAKSELEKIGPIQAKITFIKQVYAYNNQWPALYEELAKYTYKKVIYSKLAPNQGALQIDAYTPSISDAGRFLINMYKARNIFSSVAISAIPGYPVPISESGPGGGEAVSYIAQGGALPTGVSPTLQRYGGVGAIATGLERSKASGPPGLSFSVTCTLKAPITAPALPGAAAAGAPGAPGVPGAAPMGAAPAAPQM